MRVAASLVALVLWSGASLAQTQTVDKNAPAQATASKTPGAPKASAAKPAAPATATRASGEAGKAKLDGVSTMRSTPAEAKKDGGCGHSMASDA